MYAFTKNAGVQVSGTSKTPLNLYYPLARYVFQPIKTLLNFSPPPLHSPPSDLNSEEKKMFAVLMSPIFAGKMSMSSEPR